jgi:hypothetical protein
MASQVQRRDILDSSKYAQDLFKALIGAYVFRFKS